MSESGVRCVEVLAVLVLIGEGLGAQEEHVIAVLGRWVAHPDPSLKQLDLVIYDIVSNATE